MEMAHFLSMFFFLILKILSLSLCIYIASELHKMFNLYSYSKRIIVLFLHAFFTLKLSMLIEFLLNTQLKFRIIL